jgi:hypothetical protein
LEAVRIVCADVTTIDTANMLLRLHEAEDLQSDYSRLNGRKSPGKDSSETERKKNYDEILKQ